MTIPFVRDFDFDYAVLQQISPRIGRVVARNPGPFTFTGTGTYLIGRDEVAVIDPGPDDDDHFEALRRTLGGRRLRAILVTHHHQDHSPLARRLAGWAGCEIMGRKPASAEEPAVRLEAGTDTGFSPDIEVGDGWSLQLEDWTVEAIETPGHTSNHVCYALLEEDAVFTGDHIMGWSTSVVLPPDGSMKDYIQSLRKIEQRGFATLYPSHGAPITEDPNGFIESYIQHRLMREKAILDALESGAETIPEVVSRVYRDIDKSLHPAACHSVLAHMIDLAERRIVGSEDGKALIGSSYRLMRTGRS
jgi:glyoxylase-like metal-dependent hydrolase (beta-lactamase superfamily II)